MYKKISLLIATLSLFIFGCSSPGEISNSDLEDYQVKKTTDESVESDFVFRLVSEKETYEADEDVQLYGEIIYTGEKDTVTIHHASSSILFSLEEKTRGYNIDYAVNDIGLSTVLKKDEPYREVYTKSGGFTEDDPRDYVKFMENFLEMDSFPVGYYVVNGETDFYLEDEEWINIWAKVDFKVAE